jgi:hypothetical protein
VFSAILVAPVEFPKVIVLAFAPVPKFIAPVVPESIVRAVAAGVVRSAACPPARVSIPVPVVEIFPEVVTASPDVLGERVVPVLFQNPKLPDVGAVVVRILVPSVYTAELMAKPVSVILVNLPVDAVVAPIAVELIPVAVVLKFEEVKVRALAPVEIEEAERPERDSVPEVAVKFNAPVV